MKNTSVSTLSTTALITANLDRMNTLSRSTLSYGDIAIAQAQTPISLEDFDELKSFLDRRHMELIEEDGAYVDEALNRLYQVQAVVAAQVRQLSEVVDHINKLFNSVDLSKMPNAAATGGKSISTSTAVHAAAE